jgi:hypothetical protein
MGIVKQELKILAAAAVAFSIIEAVAVAIFPASLWSCLKEQVTHILRFKANQLEVNHISKQCSSEDRNIS